MGIRGVNIPKKSITKKVALRKVTQIHQIS